MGLFDVISDTAGRVVSNVVRNVASAVGGPALARLASVGLPSGGSRVLSSLLGGPNVTFDSPGNIRDWRVRIGVSPAALEYSGVMSPLNQTDGVIFPYTPQVTVTHQANYTPQRLTHTNYPAYSYENSEVQAIQISGEFTVQNRSDANYLLACIYFFRTTTKMFFGQGQLAGNPPPIVFLNGYGDHYFPNVPCLVTQFTHTMPPDVDYVETGESNSGGGDFFSMFSPADMFGGGGGTSSTRLPTTSTLTVTLQPIYSKIKAGQFDLDSFGRGDLINGGFI